MALEFKLPDIGEGIAEGEIVKWLVKVGDVVKEHQSIVEVMTDKATVEVPAPAPGKITKIHAKEGDRVPVGSVLFTLDTSASGASAPNAASASNAPAAKSASAAPAPSKNASAPQAPAKPTAAAQPAAHSAAKQPAAASGAMLDFKLPDIGEGIAEGEIVKWLVKQGDVVKEHQSIVEVMTDKATVEVPSPANGTITKLNAKEGERVPVGHVLFTLALAGAAAKSAGSSAGSGASTSASVA